MPHNYGTNHKRYSPGVSGFAATNLVKRRTARAKLRDYFQIASEHVRRLVFVWRIVNLGP